MKNAAIRLPLGVAFLALVVGVCLWDRGRDVPLVSSVLVALLGVAALGEYLAMVKDRAPPTFLAAAFLGGLFVLLGPLAVRTVSADPGFLIGALVSLALGFLAVALLGLRWQEGVQPQDLGSLGTAFLGVVLVSVPLALLGETLFLPREGVLFVLMIVLTSKLNDMGGYLIGSTLGRHKLCPGISPNKTWEGALGGLALSIAGALLLVLWVPPLALHLGWHQGLMAGLSLGIATQLGDLTESAVKRSAGVKDSAALIPAFGGILDLVDSLIFAAPLGYILGSWWLS